MIWIDRLGIVWAFVAGIPLALLFNAPSIARLDDSFFTIAWVVIIGGPWALLRGLWWAATGGTAR